MPELSATILLRPCIRLCLFAVFAGACALGTRARADTLLVLSDQAATYQQVADELRAGIKSQRGSERVDVVSSEHVMTADDQLLKNYDLVITVGLAAARSVVARETTLPAIPPTLCLLIPRQAFERLTPRRGDGRPHRLSAVFIDQPLSRQLDLLRIALPGRMRIGVVLGPTSAELAKDLREGARERDVAVDIAEIAESAAIYSALQRVLPASDALLALPDPVVFNASTAYGMMLTSYRAQVPVIGFSEGLVKAGALLGLYSTASQVARQGAEIAGRFLTGDAALPAPQYPRYFAVSVNHTVARSLGISLDDDATLASKLAARGDGRQAPLRPTSVDSATPGKAP
jgi:ABC-type uncharacterized transport system substrate-binding protein